MVRKVLATLALSAAAAMAGWTCDAQPSSQGATPRTDLTLTGAVVAHIVRPASNCTTSNASTGKMLNAFIKQPPYQVAIGIAGYHGAGHYELSLDAGAFVMVTDRSDGRARQWANGSGAVTVDHAGNELSGTVDISLSGVSIPTPDGVVGMRGAWDCQQVREVGS